MSIRPPDHDPELAAAGVVDVTDVERHGGGVLSGTHDGNGNPRRPVIDPEPPSVEVEVGQVWRDPTGQTLAPGVTMEVLERVPASDLRGACWRCQTSIGAELMRADSSFAGLELVPRVAVRADDGSFKSPAEHLQAIITKMRAGEAPSVDELERLSSGVRTEAAVSKAGLLLAAQAQWEGGLKAALKAIVRQQWSDALEHLEPLAMSVASAPTAVGNLIDFCRQALTGGVSDLGGAVLRFLAGKGGGVQSGDVLMRFIMKRHVDQHTAMMLLRDLVAAELLTAVQIGPENYNFALTDAGRALIS